MRLAQNAMTDVDDGTKRILFDAIGGEERAREFADRLVGGMDELPKHEGRIYRGLAFDDDSFERFRAQIEAGKIEDPGLSSWSASGGVASTFTQDLIRRNRVILTKRNRQGVAISEFTSRPEELEILHPPASFRVTGTRTETLRDGSEALIVEIDDD